MPAGARWVVLPGLALAYALLAHYTNTHFTPGAAGLGVVLALTPLAAAAFALAWGSSRRSLALLLLAALALLAYTVWRQLHPHFSLLYWAEHAGTELLLCLGFVRTLRPGQIPMCSRFAALIEGPLSPEVRVYTRHVTQVWSWFFALMSASSTLLYFAAPLADWSLFANFMTGPLMGLLFIAEYVVRKRRFPHTDHAGLLATVRACFRRPSH